MKNKSYFVGKPCQDDACVSGQPFMFHDLCVVNGVLKNVTSLFNRAESMSQLYGMSSAKEFLDGLQQAFARPLSPLAEARKQMSDDDLFKCIKRRNCQTPAEMEEWLRHIDVEQLKYLASLPEEPSKDAPSHDVKTESAPAGEATK